MQSEITIREAIAKDLAHLYRLEQQVIDAERPFNDSIRDSNAHYYDIPALIAGLDSVLLVAQVDSEIVATGYSQIRKSKDSLKHEKHAYLGFMLVDSQFRGQGLNQRIIEALITWGESQGISDHYLDVYAQNKAAINAYQKAGFKPSMIEMKLSN